MPKWYKRKWYESVKPEIGKVVYGEDIGKQERRKYIYEPCPNCAAARWVDLRNSGAWCRKCNATARGKSNKGWSDKMLESIIERIEAEFKYKIYPLLLDLCEETDQYGYFYSKKTIAGILEVNMHVLDLLLKKFKLRPMSTDMYNGDFAHPTVFEDYCWSQELMSPRRFIESCRWKTVEEILEKAPISRAKLFEYFKKYDVRPWVVHDIKLHHNTYWYDSPAVLENDRITRRELQEELV